MENKNGRGIFYGVIGVATLIVAIIGATFAYFASTASGTNGAVNAGSVNLAGTLTITDTADTRTQLIPTTPAIMKQSYEQTGTDAKAKCKGVSAADDTAIYDLCSPYEFTLKNDATVAQQVYLSLTTGANTFTNLQYCVYEGAAPLTTTTKVECKAVPAASTPEALFNVNLAAGESKTYTVVLFINETNADQTSTDSGKAYAGTISASTADGTNNVTGVLSTAG